jgi:hypothetical protein
MTSENLSLETQELLGSLREKTQSPEERARLQLAMDALRFISSTGQTYDFEDYRKSLEEDAPPLVIASFDNLAEAEAWLSHHPNPPHHGSVLIAGKYHLAMYSREKNRRYLPPEPILGFYLADMIRDGLPTVAASFSTLEEATSWLHAQNEPPRQVFVTIAGEYYLAAYHYRVKLRALYPISLAAKPEPQGPAGQQALS